jgi:hypothetical protein
METTEKTHNGVPYQYKLNNKKRAITDREGLESDEEEVEISRLWRILRKSYMKHMNGRQEVHGQDQKETLLSTSFSVEPITPCATNTPKRKPPFRQSKFSGRKEKRSTYKQGEASGGSSLGNSSQISTHHRGSRHHSSR